MPKLRLKSSFPADDPEDATEALARTTPTEMPPLLQNQPLDDHRLRTVATSQRFWIPNDVPSDNNPGAGVKRTCVPMLPSASLNSLLKRSSTNQRALKPNPGIAIPRGAMLLCRHEAEANAPLLRANANQDRNAGRGLNDQPVTIGRPDHNRKEELNGHQDHLARMDSTVKRVAIVLKDNHVPNHQLDLPGPKDNRDNLDRKIPSDLADRIEVIDHRERNDQNVLPALTSPNEQMFRIAAIDLPAQKVPAQKVPAQKE